MSGERTTSEWQPAKYLAFSQYRMRPALELLERIESLPSETSTTDEIRIIDLGAGTGNMAWAFMKRWPHAHVTFMDSSPAMLERAKADHASLDTSRFSYMEATFDAFEPSEPVDLIFSNAALQWVGIHAHVALVPKLMSFLKPGGVLAIGIPDTRENPGCQLIVEAAKQLGWADDVADVRYVTMEREPDFYYELFTSAGVASQDIWTTTYAQIMDGENPVADFLSSTALGPYLEALGGRTSARGMQLEAKYRELVTQAYVKQSDNRTIFNMKRVFFIVTKPTV